MAINFKSPLDELVQFEEAKEELLKSRGPIAICGSTDSQKVHLLCELTGEVPLRLIVTYNESRAREIFEDAQCFHPEVFLYPAKDVLFYQADVQGNLLSRQRMAVLKQILEEKRGTIITTIDGCMDRIASPDEIYRRKIDLEVMSQVDLTDITARLSDMGYERLPQVDMPGQFAVRGDILDVYPLTEENPVRIEFFGDEVDQIRSFDSRSQRAIENLPSISLYAADEMPQLVDGKFVHSVSMLDYFDKDAAILLDEPSRMEEKADAVFREYSESMEARLAQGYADDGPVPELLAPEDVFRRLERPRTVLSMLLEQHAKVIPDRRSFAIGGRSMISYAGNFEGLIHDLKQMIREKSRIVLLSGSRTRAERLASNLRDYELPAFFAEEAEKEVLPGQILVTTGNVHKSFEYPDIGFRVISEGDLLHKDKRRKKKKSEYSGKHLTNYAELSKGDYVIHENHGLGLYQGVEQIDVGGITRDYLKITYGDGGNLYVPVTQMDLVQKYASQDAEKPPKLNRLAGAEWKKTKTKVRKAVKAIAIDLVKLYAARHDGSGFVYSPDSEEQKEFEAQFPYEETEDQLKAIQACKNDMESGKIMDRLICGDVGYGKTEIAMRAAFKAIQDGRQVAYLVPTTILAQQHYNTFVQRLKDFPIGVELLCRFRTSAQQKESLKKIARGSSDVVIGTHRILSKDVKFKDLGLLIIDEEQRFGVADKEKIKELKDTVNVISLTATPIPRTLHMSLIGIRDMSVLEEPPLDRQPVQTYVMEYNDELVREAISRELDRGGQVYFVYNRVRNIAETAAHLQGLVPDANVAYAHGQMKERELEKIMLDFVNGETDVLVTTTIIETGLDISNCNTIIINDAERLGLSQLYQLRGRVGRSNRSAYAFLMYRRDRMLKEVAEKRLSTMRQYTELGSGIKIAMRDLELRGAGNLLGAEQHGHMEAVGYDLYCKMLGEAVQEVKGGKEIADFETAIDMDIEAYIPDSYISNEAQKMDIYRRIALIRTEEDYDDMQDELIDRFGEPVRSVQNLLRVARLRALAHSVYVTEVSGNKEQIRFSFYEKAPIDPARFPDLIDAWRGDLRLIPGPVPGLRYLDQRKKNITTENTLECVRELLEAIKILLDE